MKAIKLTIERPDFEAHIRSRYEHFLNNVNQDFTADNVLYAMEYLKAVVPVKCGKGGNHVWISDFNNNRLAIIELITNAASFIPSTELD